MDVILVVVIIVVAVARLSSIVFRRIHTHTHTHKLPNHAMAPTAHTHTHTHTFRMVMGRWGRRWHVNSVELQPDKRGVEVSNLKVMSVWLGGWLSPPLLLPLPLSGGDGGVARLNPASASFISHARPQIVSTPFASSPPHRSSPRPKTFTHSNPMKRARNEADDECTPTKLWWQRGKTERREVGLRCHVRRSPCYYCCCCCRCCCCCCCCLCT